MDVNHVQADDAYVQMDGTIDRPPGSAPLNSSTTRKRKRRTTNPQYQDTGSNSNSTATPQQTSRAQMQQQRQLNIEFSFSKADPSAPATPFPQMSLSPAESAVATTSASTATAYIPSGSLTTTPGRSVINTPTSTSTTTPGRLIIDTPTSTTSTTANSTLSTPYDAIKLQLFKDTITAIPFTKMTTSVYLDLLSNHYNTILRPPTARIYDILWVHSYLFHHSHLLLELPHGKTTWRPPQFSWYAFALPKVPAWSIQEIGFKTLAWKFGLTKQEVVPGWPISHSHSFEAWNGMKTTFGWCLDVVWEIRLDVEIKGVGCNWEDVRPKVNGVRALDGGTREVREEKEGKKLRWFTMEEVRRAGESETILPELARSILGAFQARRQKEEEYMRVWGSGRH